MKIYLVRTKARELVGIFTCHRQQLFKLVDEVATPDQCEFTTLPAGGIVYPGKGLEIPLDFSGETRSARTAFTENWWNKMAARAGDPDELSWTNITFGPIANIRVLEHGNG